MLMSRSSSTSVMSANAYGSGLFRICWKCSLLSSLLVLLWSACHLSLRWVGLGTVLCSPATSWWSDRQFSCLAVQACRHKNREMDTLMSSLATLQQSTEWSVIQWISSHCIIPGNEEADRLAKDGGELLQDLHEISSEQAKTIVKEWQRRRWLQRHPYRNRQDAYYLFPREDQVISVRLMTGHCRLRYHMLTKLHIGHSLVCPCSTSPMTVEHLLQNCPTHQNLQAETWPAHKPVRVNLWTLAGPPAHCSICQGQELCCLSGRQRRSSHFSFFCKLFSVLLFVFSCKGLDLFVFLTVLGCSFFISALVIWSSGVSSSSFCSIQFYSSLSVVFFLLPSGFL